ncbi:MAG: hypothetical protein A2X49_09660 [Lentisphaerae bacterium GWF2_52_8]|nr:MAG: hypothetical protein A2X49_09660 [Lentisphaerae bacterium GWF2_52_8]
MSSNPPRKTDEVLCRNLEFIRGCSSKASFAELEAATAQVPGIRVEMAPDSREAVFTATTAGAGRILLHSRREPLEEAKRQLLLWVSEEKPSLDGLVLLVGAAGLYHLEALLPMLPDCATLLLAEQRPENLLEALRVRDITHLQKESGARLFFAVSRGLSRMAEEYRLCLSAIKCFSVAVFVPPGLRRAFPGSSAELVDLLKKEAGVEGIDRSTRAHTSDEWLRHAILNLPLCLKEAKIDALKGKWDGGSAVIVAAGPSLDESIPYLKKISGKCLLFCAGTALKPLLAAGIEPDFTVAVDSDAITMEQYRGIQKGRIFLLGSQSVFPELAEFFRGQTFYFANTALQSFNTWLASFAALPAPVAAGGTVAVPMIDLARQMGCKRVIFAGLDLAFLKDGTTHANKSMYDGSRQNLEGLVEVPGNWEKTVLTSWQFSLYIEILNSYLDFAVRESGVDFYNANTGGAAFRHAKLLRPEDLPGLGWTAGDPEKAELLQRSYKEAARPDMEKASGVTAEALTALRRLEADAEAAGNACEILAAGPEKMRHGGRLMEEILRLDRNIKANSTGNLLAIGGMEAVFMNLYNKRQEDIGANNDSAMEQSLKFYRHLQATASWVAGMLEIAMNDIRTISNL